MNNPAEPLPKRNSNQCAWWLIALTFFLNQTLYESALANDNHSMIRASYVRKRTAEKKHRDFSKAKASFVAHRVTKTKNIKAEKKVRATFSASMLGLGHAHIAVKDQHLRGAVYYLASGHGGPDPGAIGHYGKYALAEDEYAYDVTIRLAPCADGTRRYGLYDRS